MKGNIQLLDVTGDCLKKVSCSAFKPGLHQNPNVFPSLIGQQKDDEISEILLWANGIIAVYSICDRCSYNQAYRLLNEIARISPQANVILVGNKQDLEAGRKVEFDEGKALAAKHSAQFYEVSSQPR